MPQRVPLAALTTDRAGDPTLPALQIRNRGTYNVGIELSNGTVRWIEVRVA